MSINLQKGQRIDLTKGNAGIEKLLVGLGWDAVKKGIFFKSQADVDCDASALMLNAQGKLKSKKDVIYFGNLASAERSVVHTGDNVTGDGDGDDEQVIVELKKVPEHVTRILFVVNIYDRINRKQDFGLIENAFIRVVNMAGNTELVKFNLSDNFAGKTALIAGEIYRHGSEWKFAATGEGTNDVSLSELIKKYM